MNVPRLTRRKTSRACPFSILLAVLLLLTACGDQPEPVLRFGLANAPDNLDPRFATDAVSARVNRLLYQRLVDFDAHARPVPALASWERLTPRHYRFTLRGGPHRFHDGSPLTARDVKATYEFILDPTNGSPHRATVEMIREIRVLDQDTLDFHLSRADILFPAYLVIGIVPARVAVEGIRLSREPLGSGPFRFVKWHDTDQLQLERLRDGQQVRFLRVKDPTVRVLKLVRGELDLVQNDLPVELVQWLDDREDIVVTRRRGSNFSYMGLNLEDPVTGLRSVRRAIAHGIDRAAIIRHVFGNGARPAGAILPGDHWAGNTQLRGYPYAPEKARRLLVEAGVNRGARVKIGFKTSTDPLRVRLATIIQAQLAEIGLDMVVHSYDWGTFYGDIKAGRFQVFTLTWVGIKTPDIFRYVFHSESVPPLGANRGHYASPRVDSMIRAAERSGTLEEMAAYYRAIQDLLAEDLPYIPLWFEDHVVARRREISEYSTPPDGNYDGLLDAEKEIR